MCSACEHCWECCINASAAAEFVLPDQQPCHPLGIPAMNNGKFSLNNFFFLFCKATDGVEPSSGNLAEAFV